MSYITFPPGCNEAADAWGNRSLVLAREALTKLSPRRADDFDQVRLIGRVLHGVSPELYPDWCAWAAAHPWYTPERCAELWASFDRHPGKPVTLGILITWVRRDTRDETFGKPGGA